MFCKCEWCNILLQTNAKTTEQKRARDYAAQRSLQMHRKWKMDKTLLLLKTSFLVHFHFYNLLFTIIIYSFHIIQRHAEMTGLHFELSAIQHPTITMQYALYIIVVIVSI